MILAIIIFVLILIILWFIYQSNIFDWFCSIFVKRSKRYRCQQRPKRLILIRHGESQGNQDSTIYSSIPDHAIDLSEKGREQAHHCGEELRNLIGINETVICFVSPFRRSKETCQLICE